MKLFNSLPRGLLEKPLNPTFYTWPFILSLALINSVNASEQPSPQTDNQKLKATTQSTFQDKLKKIQDKLKNIAFEPTSFGPVMVRIPAGSFIMGDINNTGQSYERPLHKVTFSKGFSIGKYPITFNEYDAYTDANGLPLITDFNWGRGNRPVININIDDAISYTRWLSKQTGYTYRLPSEAEWEYAARAGSKTIYPWGDNIGHNNANCNGCDSQWDGKKTAPVGQFKANNWGLYDTQGNTWDMTSDCWNFNYQNAPTDGNAWDTGDCLRGVIRGGSLGDTPQDLRVATRLRNYFETRTVIIGFRVVRE